ncbi:MAG: hypothetical protein HFJ52_09125 [Clostridia bacterium]|nr:hypothetical protein [Clostridia bacterium]
MYFVTTLCNVDEDKRCVGYFKTFEEAENIVLNNIGDINETIYDYAIIENIPEGLYQYDQNASWYQWNNGKYEKINKPDVYNHLVGWAIG